MLENHTGDNVPSLAFYGVHYEPDLTIPTTVRREKAKKVPTLGTVVSKPKPTVAPEPEHVAVPPQEDDDDIPEVMEIEIDFPDVDETPYGPDRDGVNYRPTEYPVRGENEFDVPDSLLAEVRERTQAREEALRTTLLESASLLFAHQDASNFVEAALRDGLDMEIELDEAIPDALVPISRLNIVTSVINQMSLPEKMKNTLLMRLAIKSADEVILALNKKRVPDAIAAMHKHYAATVTKAGLEPDMEHTPQNTVGVRASRK